MNPDDPPEPHLHAVGDAELEARIVAWVLGEASAFEAAELERLCEESPELERFRDEIRAMHELVREDFGSPTPERLRLPEAKREKITALLGEEPATVLAPQSSDKKVIHYFTRRGLLMTAACIGLSAAAWPILFPSHSVRESKAVVAATPIRSLTVPMSEVGENPAGMNRGQQDIDPKLYAEELRRAVKEQEDIVEDKRQALQQIIRTQGVIYNTAARGGQKEGSDEAQTTTVAARTYVDAEEARVQLESQIKALGEPKGRARIAYAAGIEVPDNLAKALYPQYLESEAKLKVMQNQGLPADDPKVAAQQQMVDSMASDLDQSVNSLRGELSEKLDLTKETLKRMNIRKDTTREEAVKSTIADASFEDASQDFKDQTELLQKLKLQYITETAKAQAGAGQQSAMGRTESLASAAAAASKPNSEPPADEADRPALASRNALSAAQAKPGELDSLIRSRQEESASSLAGGAAGPAGDAIGGRAVGLSQTLGPSDSVEKSSAPAQELGLTKNEVGFGYVEAVRDSDQKRDEARDAYAKGDYSQAVDKTRESLQNLPDAPAVQDRRAYLTQQLADASNALGERYRRAGRYAEARELADSVLAKDPNDARAKGILSELDDPIRTNPALTAGNTENVDKVRHGLYTAEGAYNLGKYEDAKRQYEDVLRIDPYNTAARRGMEQVAQARAEYYRAAYDQTRAEMLVPGSQIQPDSADNESRAKLLAQLDAAWEITRPPLPKIEGLFGITQGSDTKGSSEENELSLGGAPKRKAGQLALGYGFGGSLSYQAPQDLEDHFVLAGQEMRIAPEPRSFFYDSTDPALFGRRNVDAVLNAPESNFFRMPYTDENGIQHLPQSLANAPASPSAPPPAVESPVKAEESVSPALKEISAAAEAYSTFSLHVSDVSFRLAKAALDRGERPAPESIREEEFYNAVDYGDPSAGQQPVACVVEQSAHPVRPQRNLVRIAVRTGSSGRAATMPLNLVLLLDSSGSMEREDRHTSLLKAVQALSTLLKDGDTVSVVGFSRKPRLLVDRLSGAEASKLNSIIADSPVEGGTDLAQGLKLAGELAARQFQANGQNRVVLFTDGAANLGDADPDSLAAQIGRFRAAGIAFDAAGFGAEGLNDKLLEQLTRHGNGRYYVVNRPVDAEAGFARQLAGAFRPAAEDVKVQVHFNPARVGHYRLAGFAEHRLKKEDFHNDSVDAAEMAAEEAGNALYEVEPLAGGEGEIGEVSVRFRNAATGEMVEQSWTIPWQEQTPAFDQAKPTLQLAGLALMTAEKLKGGPAADAIDFSTMSAVVANVRQACGASSGVAQLLEMIGKLR